MLEHWLSYKRNFLPFASQVSGLDLAAIYDESRKKLQDYDFYEFQTLSIADVGLPVVKAFGTHNTFAEASASLRLWFEEAYAVMAFEKAGCKVIRPAPALVEILRDVEVDWKITDIAAPYFHVYIALPPDSGITCAGDEGLLKPSGIYVTWTKAGEATRRARAHAEKVGLVVDEAGSLLPSDVVSPGAQVKKADVDLDNVFGDWVVRFTAVSRMEAPRVVTHPWIVTYYQVRWGEKSEEIAEGMLERMNAHYAARQRIKPAYLEFNTKLFHLACNLFLYMSQKREDQDVEWRPSPEREALRQNIRDWNNKRRKRAKARIAEEMPIEEWLVGHNIVIDRGIEPVNTVNPEPGTHASPRPHWRRGHWHRYWVGAKDSSERRLVPKLLSPVLVMKARGDAPQTTTYEVKM